MNSLSTETGDQQGRGDGGPKDRRGIAIENHKDQIKEKKEKRRKKVDILGKEMVLVSFSLITVLVCSGQHQRIVDVLRSKALRI